MYAFSKVQPQPAGAFGRFIPEVRTWQPSLLPVPDLASQLQLDDATMAGAGGKAQAGGDAGKPKIKDRSRAMPGLTGIRTRIPAADPVAPADTCFPYPSFC
jgi:hypothetical protein